MERIFSSWIARIAILSAIIISAYFINVEVQSYYGRQALQNTGLQSLTFNQALIQANEENKLVLVDVSAIWCSTCRKLDNEVFSESNVRRFIEEQFIFSRIEYESEEGQNFIAKYKVTGFPTVLLIDKRGNVFKRLEITFNPDEFLTQLR